jgi:hypothetical protein
VRKQGEIMSNVYVSRDYGDVRIISRDLDYVVQRFVEYNDQGWTDVNSFNQMSDDYAITNANNYALALVAKLKGELV